MSDSHDIKDAPVAPLENEIVEIEGVNQENEEGQEQQTQFNFHQEGQTSANYNYPYMQGPVNGMMVPVYLPPMAIPMYPGYYAPNAASYLWPAASYGPGSYPVMYMPTPQYDPYEQTNEYQETGYETEEGQQETNEQPGGQQQQQQQQSTETSAPGSAAPGAQQNQPLNANQQRAIKHRVRVEDRLAKTELCRTFARLGTCPYGHNCQFAHGVEELRPRLFDSKFKTEYCANYHKTGACRFGSRCKFIHDDYWEAGPNGQYILISPSENVVRMELPTQRARILQLEALSRNRLNLNLQEQAQLTDLLNNLRITRKAKLDNQRAIVTLPLSTKTATSTDAKTTTTATSAPSSVATTSSVNSNAVAANASVTPAVVSNSASVSSASTPVSVSAASSPEFPALPAKVMEGSMVAPAKRSFLSIVASTNKPVDPPGA